MAETTKKKPAVLRKQAPMRRVLIASLPCILGSIYYFGWRSLAVILVSCIAAFFAEYTFTRRRGEPVSEAIFVTAVLYALVLPPTVPWHVIIIGIVFAVVFAKEVFGGFGRNIFNPAISGRCFVYICFPVAMTARWAPAAEGPLGALLKWSTSSGMDALATATPSALMKAGVYAPTVSDLWARFFLGRMDGAMGVTSALLILVGGIYLYVTKTANRPLILWTICTYAALGQILNWFGVGTVPPGLTALMSGGFLFGAFFMVTDPVSGPKTPQGRIYYAILVACCTLIIRNFSIFNGGMMFAIMLGNMFAPIIDHAVKAAGPREKAPAKPQRTR